MFNQNVNYLVYRNTSLIVDVFFCKIVLNRGDYSIIKISVKTTGIHYIKNSNRLNSVCV